MADGRITVRDLLDRRPSGGRLATLSVCEGSLPGIGFPEAAVSLVGALMRTGFAGVIGATEKVSDGSSAILMSRFYELWRNDGLEPPLALRAAQQWVRDATNQQLLTQYPDLICYPEFMSDPTDPSWDSARPYSNLWYWSSVAYHGW